MPERRSVRSAPDPFVREVFHWLRGITAPVHGHLGASVVFRILNLTLDVAMFAIAAGAVAHLLTGGAGLGRLSLLLAATAIAKGGAYYLEQFMGHHVAFKAVELLREHVYDSLEPRAPAVVTESRSGEVFATLTRDVDRIDIVYAHTVARFISAHVVGVVVSALAVRWVGWGPVWIAVAALAVSVLVVPYLGLRSALAQTARGLDARAELVHHLTDTQFGIREVIGYTLEEERLHQTDRLGARVAGHSRRARNIMALRRAANIALLLSAAAWMLLHNLDTLSLPVVAALTAGTLRAFEGARAVEDATGYFDHALAAARRLWRLSHSPQRVQDGASVLHLDGAPEVAFTDVHYLHPGETGRTPALTGVSLTIPPGAHVALVGRSGSGKSTLVNLLQRFDDPVSGSITLNGQEVSDYTLQSLRAHVVSVSQRSQMLKSSIADNLRLGVPEASESELWEALTVAGMADEVKNLPEGLDTVVGESATTLSGGQVQRLSLARALLMRPRVLILDEFTAHLNVDLEESIWENLTSALGGVTIIEVTHRMDASGRADEVAVVEAGQIIARGTPAELSPAKVQSLFRELRGEAAPNAMDR